VRDSRRISRISEDEQRNYGWRCSNVAGLAAATAILTAAATADRASGETIPNVTYATAAINVHSGGGTRTLLLDVYKPDPPSTGARPALVLVHGGSFTSGNKTMIDMIDAATHFQARGWVCFSINYRLTGDDPPAPPEFMAAGAVAAAAHAAAVDTRRAIRWVRRNAAAYGVDPRRVAAFGHSAGAYCTLWAAICNENDFANDAGVGPPDLYAEQGGKPNACVEVSGAHDRLGDRYDPRDPPIMVWHGDADQTVPYTNAVAVARACRANGIPYRLFTLPGADHAIPTWLALHGGKNVKQHAAEFLDLFFNLGLGARLDPGGAIELSWSSVSNAAYRVTATRDLLAPFTNSVLADVRAVADSVRVAAQPLAGGHGFYRVEVRSGQ
jgi:acetyl esterase/lipase